MERKELLTQARLMKSKEENLKRLCRFLKMSDDADFLQLVFRVNLFVGWNPIPKPVQKTEEERNEYEKNLEDLFVLV